VNNPAEIIIAFFELLEAEGRDLRRSIEEITAGRGSSLRRSVLRLATSLALTLSAAVLVLASIGMALWGCYLHLLQAMAPPQAALATSGMTLGAAVLLWVFARWLSR
jgi:hypothetical protein